MKIGLIRMEANKILSLPLQIKANNESSGYFKQSRYERHSKSVWRYAGNR